MTCRLLTNSQEWILVFLLQWIAGHNSVFKSFSLHSDHELLQFKKLFEQYILLSLGRQTKLIIIHSPSLISRVLTCVFQAFLIELPFFGSVKHTISNLQLSKLFSYSSWLNFLISDHCASLFIQCILSFFMTFATQYSVSNKSPTIRLMAKPIIQGLKSREL